MLAKRTAEREWNAVFNAIRTFKNETFPEIDDTPINAPHWASAVGRTLKDLRACYTNTANEQNILRQYGRWFQTEKLRPNASINFNYCTIALESNSKNEKIFDVIMV